MSRLCSILFTLFVGLTYTIDADSEDVFRMDVEASQGYLRTGEGPRREFTLKLSETLKKGTNIYFSLSKVKWSEKATDSSEMNFLFPCGYMNDIDTLRVCIEGGAEKSFEILPARQWKVCFLPHSHLDIGYTHHQDEVMKLQWRNLERALELSERTSTYPKSSQFKWNTEATWPIAGYLNEYHGTPKEERLISAIKEGKINVDASLGSILTGICRQEELMHLFDDAHTIEERTGVLCNTAMMSDVPGQVWGIVTALAQNGVKYFSPGPNYVPMYGRIGNDRAAALHVKWGDRPFYWQSQSGTDQVLVFEAGRGYSWFHGWLAGKLSVCGVRPIWQYLTQLESEEYPYRMCYLRYTIDGDNGPPDESMSDIIRDWNEKYVSPEFCISTTKSFFEEFENEYRDELSIVRGDMTPTWEDGAASSARETAMNRETSAELAQNYTLWSMLCSKETFPESEFNQAFKNAILYSEHTWGSAASGQKPNDQFTIDLWRTKKAFADSARSESNHLREEALSMIKGSGPYIQILNTNLWARTDIIIINAEGHKEKCLMDEEGNIVPTQSLRDGGIAFIAKDVPGLASKVYKLINEVPHTSNKQLASRNILDNGLVRVIIDSLTGAISSLRGAGDEYEYADDEGLNSFLYTGRVGANPQGIGKIRSIGIIENGPVLATIRTICDAPGCNSLTRDITIYNGIQRVDIVNTIDKKDIVDFENVRFVFPFNFPHPELTLDLAMSEVHPEREQLAGVNKHYYSVQNGLSIGDLEHGICLTSIDAPFVEFGSPSAEDYRLNPRYGWGWWPSAQISSKVYSWIMTNTWRTNYKASQGGTATFRYSLSIGNPLNLELKRMGLEAEQKMIPVMSSEAKSLAQLFRMKGHSPIALSMLKPSRDGKGYIIALHNMSDNPVHSGFTQGSIKIKSAHTCDFREAPLQMVESNDFWMKPHQYLRIKIVCNE